MRMFLFTLAATLLLCIGLANADGITISSFDGGWDNNTKVTTDRPVTWTFHFNTLTNGIVAYHFGFKVYLSDQINGSNVLNPGPGFTPVTYHTVNDLGCATYGIVPLSIDGLGADTIGFYALDCTWGSGIFVDIDVWSISTQVNSNISGYYLCIDSSFYRPNGVWIWSPANAGSYPPPWDGPYCYLIENGCITRGDANHDGRVLIDDYFVIRKYLFEGGSAPVSPYEGDVNGDGNIYVSDLVYMVDYLFKGGPPPPPCD